MSWMSSCTACGPKWTRTRRGCKPCAGWVMFLNNLLRNFAFRLSLWYALIFVLCTAVLLALVYYLVGSAFQRKDQEIILAQLKQYATLYQAAGPEALRAR